MRRAISVSRRNDGLFNLGQLELMEREIASQVALGDMGGVLEERQFAVRIADQNFGKNDPRVVPALRQLAEAYEIVDAYDEARRAYFRIYKIGQQEGGKSNPTVIDALLGIGRSHRLQFTRIRARRWTKESRRIRLPVKWSRSCHWSPIRDRNRSEVAARRSWKPSRFCAKSTSRRPRFSPSA